MCASLCVQNADASLLFDGSASLAAVKPLKATTFEALSFLWRQLRMPTGPGKHPGVTTTEAPDDAAPFLGLTHDSLIARVRHAHTSGGVDCTRLY